MIPEGRSLIGEASLERIPNLSAAAPDKVMSVPCLSEVKTAKVSVEIAEVKKTSQSMPKVQKVVGFEIS